MIPFRRLKQGVSLRRGRGQTEENGGVIPAKSGQSHQTGWGVPSGTNRRRLIEVEGMASRWVRLANGARGHYMTSDTTGPAVVPLYGAAGIVRHPWVALHGAVPRCERASACTAQTCPDSSCRTLGKSPWPTACTAMRTSSMSSPLRCACMVPCRRQLDGLLEHGELR